MKQDTLWKTKKVRPFSYPDALKATHLLLFCHFLLFICSTLSHSKLFNSYLKKSCSCPSSQNALWQGRADWAVSIVALGICLSDNCGMAQKAKWEWELSQSPILGFPFQFFLSPRGSQDLLSGAIIAHSCLSIPGKGFSP